MFFLCLCSRLCIHCPGKYQICGKTAWWTILHLQHGAVKTRWSVRGGNLLWILKGVCCEWAAWCSSQLRMSFQYLVAKIQKGGSHWRGMGYLTVTLAQDPVRKELSEFRKNDSIYLGAYWQVSSIYEERGAVESELFVLWADRIVYEERWSGRGSQNEWMVSLRKKEQEFKIRIVFIIEEHYETGFYTMNLDLLNHQCEDMGKFETVRIPNASVYEHFNTVMTRAYWITGRKGAGWMQKTSCALDSIAISLQRKETDRAARTESCRETREGFINQEKWYACQKWMRKTRVRTNCYGRIGVDMI